MNELDALLAARGFITRPEILDCGYDDSHIREARKAGVLIRIGPGLYADGPTYGALSVEQQHILRCHAVMQRHGQNAVLTHQSAALMHGIAVWGTDLSQVNLTRLDTGRGRHEAGVFHHVGHIDEWEIEEIDGLLVATAPRAVWETACTSTVESGLVTVDSALHLKQVTEDELRESAARFDYWQGSRAARLTLRLADGRAESPGETRSRYLFWRHGIPKPDLQFTVKDANGRVVGHTDFGWLEYCHVAEFDGMIKYSGTFGEDGSQTLTKEKAREDLIRRQSFGVSRIVWRELAPHNAANTARRIMYELEQSRRLYGHNRVRIAI